jgi:DNA-binding NtrC family response regulator
VASKEFREDLFFRLAMVEIQLPRLAERREDLPLLIRHFLEKFSLSYGKHIDGLTRRAEAVLGRYSWPGNIRELENTIGYASMMTDSTVIDIYHLPDAVKATTLPLGPSQDLVSLDEMQRIHARRVLEHFGGDKIRTAELLGVSRSTLYRLLSGDAAVRSEAAGLGA